jgi:redox-sensitive bicupin YhaK (pirin superfamily)
MIKVKTSGRTMGPITRLISPLELGRQTKPFVFLDLAQIPPSPTPTFRWHPHSGIATVTVVLDGELSYEETTGTKGTLPAGSVEWVRCGHGVWHTGSAIGRALARGFQLWLSLPPDQELLPPVSRYYSPGELPAAGPAVVVLGSYLGTSSPIAAPPGILYLSVNLAVGESWEFKPPQGNTVNWLAVSDGSIELPDHVAAGELVVFEPHADRMAITARSGARFVLGSAVPHPHELVVGSYSVHTNGTALATGEAEIVRIQRELQARRLIP